MQPANPTKPQKDAIFRTSGRYAAFAGDEPALAILYICERAEAVYICERAEAVVFELENPVVVVKRLLAAAQGHGPEFARRLAHNSECVRRLSESGSQVGVPKM